MVPIPDFDTKFKTLKHNGFQNIFSLTMINTNY